MRMIPADTGVNIETLDCMLRDCTYASPYARDVVVRRFREGADIGYSGSVDGGARKTTAL